MMTWQLVRLNGILLAMIGYKFRRRHMALQAWCAAISIVIILILAIQLWPLLGIANRTAGSRPDCSNRPVFEVFADIRILVSIIAVCTILWELLWRIISF